VRRSDSVTGGFQSRPDLILVEQRDANQLLARAGAADKLELALGERERLGQQSLEFPVGTAALGRSSELGPEAVPVTAKPALLGAGGDADAEDVHSPSLAAAQ
jgi:hypothetical protein